MNYIALPSSFSIPISRRMKWNHNIILNTISFLYNIQYNTFKLIFLSKNVFLISPQVWCVATGHPAGRMIGVIVAPSWVCNPFTFAISWSPSRGAYQPRTTWPAIVKLSIINWSSPPTYINLLKGNQSSFCQKKLWNKSEILQHGVSKTGRGKSWFHFSHSYKETI